MDVTERLEAIYPDIDALADASGPGRRAESLTEYVDDMQMVTEPLGSILSTFIEETPKAKEKALRGSKTARRVFDVPELLDSILLRLKVQAC